jgi:hypothetical protein
LKLLERMKRGEFVTAGRCELRARGIDDPSAEALAGAMLDAEYKISMIAFLKGLSGT